MFFSQVKCKLCKKKEPRKKTWQVVVNTAEGSHKIRICSECADTLDKAEQNIEKWLK